MDQQISAASQAQEPPTASQSTPLPPTKKNGGFLGKLLLFIVIAGILIVGGYFIGTLGYKTPATETPVPTMTQSQVVNPTQTTSPTTSASATTKIVKAGLATSKTFKAYSYSIAVPTGWTDARETTVTADIDKLTLTKNGNSLTIYQAAMGGGGCLYPGDKPSEMAQSFTNFIDIFRKSTESDGQNEQYRRSWNKPGTEKTISYTVCQKSPVDNSYNSLTAFGAINVVTGNPSDSKVLNEIDTMIASIIKQ